MTLETYARLLALLAVRRGARIDDVLSELGISVGELHRDEAALRAQLAGLWPRRKGVAAMQFASALGEALVGLAPLSAGVDAAADLVQSIAREKLPSSYMPSFSPTEGGTPPGPPSVDIGTFQQPVRFFEPPSLDTETGERPTLPFEPPGKQVARFDPMTGERLAEPILVDAASKRPASPLAATMDPDMGAIVAALARGALPFKQPSPSSDPEASAILTGLMRPPASPTTEVLPVMDTSKDAPGRSSLELYAAVCGAVAHGTPREQALVAHGLSEEDFSKLIHTWAPKFAQDPELRARFKEMAKSYAASARRSP